MSLYSTDKLINTIIATYVWALDVNFMLLLNYVTECENNVF